MNQKEEREAIASAYGTEVERLFATLVDAMVTNDQPDMVERFAKGLAILRKARAVADQQIGGK